MAMYSHFFKETALCNEEIYGDTVGNTCVCVPVFLLVICHLLLCPQSLIIKTKILLQMIPKTMRADEAVL